MSGGGIVAVVPTRKGSQRVPSKNTRPFAGSSLLELKLEVMKSVNGIDSIIVNTDCPESVKIAKRFGVDYHVRDPHFASSSITNDEHWRHLAETTSAESILLAQTTSPLVRVSTFEEAIARFRGGECDSVASVTSEKKFLWQDGEPINYDVSRTPKSQDLPDIVSLNFAITLLPASLMREKCNVIGDRPDFMKLSSIESVDVDDPIDFEFAEFLYKRQGREWLLGS